MCIWVTHKGHKWHKCWEQDQAVYPQRQDADAAAQGEVTRIRLWGSVIFAVPPRNNTLDCMYSFYLPEFTKIWMSVTCWPQGERKSFFFLIYFWKWDLDISAWRETFNQTRQIPKLREGDSWLILRLFIFLCLTLSWGLSASTFTNWHHDMTEWLVVEGEIVSGVPVEINLNASVVLFICLVMAF